MPNIGLKMTKISKLYIKLLVTKQRLLYGVRALPLKSRHLREAKKGNLMTQCACVSWLYLEQLERLKALQQAGILTSEEFEEQKAYALKNIRELNKRLGTTTFNTHI